MPGAVYSEFDPKAAAWLRELIKQGHIADGEVDERDLWDVAPDDYRGFTQVHLCAGIGVWSYALRQCGWPDDRPVWTASFPCQPFSVAGKGAGFADERHLWPAGEHLIRQLEPRTIFGEQVASKDAEPWLDAVQTDLEALGYAFGACAFPSSGVGAPHIRDRLYWVADAGGKRGRSREPRRGHAANAGVTGEVDRLADDDDVRHERLGAPRGRRVGPAHDSSLGGVADSAPSGRREERQDAGRQPVGDRAQGLAAGFVDGFDAGGMGNAEQFGAGRDAGTGDSAQGGNRRGAERDDARPSGAVVRMVDALGAGTQRHPRDDGQTTIVPQEQRQPEDRAALSQRDGASDDGRGVHGGGRLSDDAGRPGPVNGFWRAADWLFCKDAKWRPVRSSAQQMVDGSTESLGHVCDSSLREVETAVESWALRHQRDGTEGVRDLWDLLSQEEVEQRTDGGFDSVQEAPFLLAFLRQLSNQGWRFPLGAARSSSKAARRTLRVLWYDSEPYYSSRGRGLVEQQSDESTDPLRQLSQILAWHTEICWGQTGWQDANSFPLIHKAPARVARLRGYGNAVNAEAAKAWIESYLDTQTIEG